MTYLFAIDATLATLNTLVFDATDSNSARKDVGGISESLGNFGTFSSLEPCISGCGK